MVGAEKREAGRKRGAGAFGFYCSRSFSTFFRRPFSFAFSPSFSSTFFPYFSPFFCSFFASFSYPFHSRLAFGGALLTVFAHALVW